MKRELAEHARRLPKEHESIGPKLANDWHHALAVTTVIAALGTVYFLTLQRGVSRGDSAELQYLSPLLGICHSPGYAIEVVGGYLAILLPIGDVAYRVNLLMAISGIVGCLALYGAVRRITGLILPSLLAAGLLGFSSIYWSYSTVAEEYIFHAAFLLIGVYAAVRFVNERHGLWLWVTALTVGISTAGRPSELFVVPAFFGLWLGWRRSVRLTARRLAVAVLLYFLPLVFSVAFFLVRDNPRYLHARDGVLADEIIGRPATSSLTGWPRLKEATYYTLGLSWVKHRDTWGERIEKGVTRYSRLLSVTDAISAHRQPDDPLPLERGIGASIGLPGVLLAITGMVFRRRQYGWVLLGLGLFGGNLLFFLWHQTWDALTFTVPGLSGLALLGGLGAAGPPQGSTAKTASQPTDCGRHWRVGALLIGGATVLGLLIGNYRLVDRSRLTDAARVARLVAGLKELPPDSMIVSTYWPAVMYRYLAYVSASRQDLRILAIDPEEWNRALAFAGQRGRAAFLLAGPPVNARTLEALFAKTPRAAAEAGLVQAVAPASRPG